MSPKELEQAILEIPDSAAGDYLRHQLDATKRFIAGLPDMAASLAWCERQWNRLLKNYERVQVRDFTAMLSGRVTYANVVRSLADALPPGEGQTFLKDEIRATQKILEVNINKTPCWKRKQEMRVVSHYLQLKSEVN